MNKRIDIKDFVELEKNARGIFIDGIITGQKLADTVSRIIQMAAAFGADEAEAGEVCGARVSDSVQTFEDLKVHAVSYAVENMFKAQIDTLVYTLCLYGYGFGYRNIKNKMAA